MDFVEWGNAWLENEKEKKKQNHKESSKTWNKTHPEKIRAMRKKYNDTHPESVKASEKRYRETHREEISKRTKVRREHNPETIRSWRRTHPEQVKTAKKKAKNKRKRNLGFIPLNTYFEGSDAHHIDKDHVVYIPSELHKSIPHSVLTGKNMKEINKLVLDYFEKITEVKNETHNKRIEDN